MVDVEAGDEWWFGGASGMQAVIRPLGGPSYESIAVYGFDVGADDEPTVRANMTLIAAAPDLLEAAKFLISVVTLSPMTSREYHAGLAQASAAIAKAEGNQ
jgi:hypothetical protein